MMQKLIYKAQLSHNWILTGAATPCLPTIPAEENCKLWGLAVVEYYRALGGYVEASGGWRTSEAGRAASTHYKLACDTQGLPSCWHGTHRGLFKQIS
jgi:hypothetical protein